MKIYFTITFKRLLNKSFWNYYIDLEDLSKWLRKTYENNIYLKRPIMKFKLKINWVSFRLVWIVKDEIILPLVIFLKKDN